jgi:hypothetical protein
MMSIPISLRRDDLGSMLRRNRIGLQRSKAARGAP